MKKNDTKIYLLPITIEDTDNIIKWRNSDFVKENFIYQKDFTYESHLYWLNNVVNTGKAVQFIIYKSETNKAIGSTYFKDIDNKNSKAEFGIFIGEKDDLGKGYGSETAKQMINYGFTSLELHKIYLRVFAKNIAAIKSYKNAGFEISGHFKEEIRINDNYYDIIFMEKINNA